MQRTAAIHLRNVLGTPKTELGTYDPQPPLKPFALPYQVDKP